MRADASSMKKFRNRVRVEFPRRDRVNQLASKVMEAQRIPTYRVSVENLVDASLNNLSNAFGWCIHNGDKVTEIKKETNSQSHRDLRRASRKAKERLGEAWYYLSGYSDNSGKPLDQFVSPSVFRTVARIIDPRNQDFRGPNQEARIFYPEYKAPCGFQVPGEVEALTDRIRGSVAGILEKAIHLQLEIIGIQPFEFGNKRLGRFLQQRVLYDHGLPPILVYPAEREEYCSALKDALIGGPGSEGQQRFYDLMLDGFEKSLKRITENGVAITG